MVNRTGHLAERLTSRSLDYVTARRAFQIAVDEARCEGWTDEDVCRATGLSRRKVEAIAGPRQGPRDGAIEPVPAAHVEAA